jgi:hypothetical protein
MSPTQQAAQQLAQAIARFRLADRDAQQAIARISYTYAVVRTHHRIQP